MIDRVLAYIWLRGIGLVDIVLVGLVVFGLYRGYRNGLAKELRYVFELVAGTILAMRFALHWADWISAKINFPLYFVHGLLFIILLFSFALAVKIVLKVLSKAGTVSFAAVLEKGVGTVMGGLRYAMFFSIICYALLLFRTPYLKEKIVDRSKTGRFLTQFPNALHFETMRFFDRLAVVRQLK